jgi:hypothetical protein
VSAAVGGLVLGERRVQLLVQRGEFPLVLGLACGVAAGRVRQHRDALLLHQHPDVVEVADGHERVGVDGGDLRPDLGQPHQSRDGSRHGDGGQDGNDQQQLGVDPQR